AVAGAQAGKNAVENNYLSATEALSFDQELQTCTAKGNCDAVREKYGKLSEENSEKLKAVCQERPLTCEVYYKEVIQGGIATTERPDWLYKSMSTDEAKAFVQQVNGQDLALIDTTSESWMKFAAFASDPENQAAVLSLGVAGKNLIQLAQNSLATKSLLKEMTAQGIKYSPENIVSVARDSSGKIIFLETGSPTAGLQHIIKEHGSQFSQLGVSEAQIPSVVMKAVTQGKVVGYQGSGTGRPIYETIINGQKYNIAVTVGSNGYIVGANLRGVVK
ncbi:VENN motif pre-toxin domain-containing protein, partial [Yersinia similis]